MTKSILFFLFTCMLISKLEAQESKPLKNSIGINVTSLLSEVISIGDNKNTDKFNILYTHYGSKSNFRIGVNAFYNKESENNILIGSGITALTEQAYKIRMGFEKRNDLSHKFNFTYGIDALYIYEASNSEAESGFENTNTINSIGLGPVLRFEYKLSKRISLMTESTMYFIAGNNRDKLTQLGSVIQDKTTKKSNLTTTIPSVLYLNIHF